MPREVSPLESARLGYAPKLPRALEAGISGLAIEERDVRRAAPEIRERFPRTADRPGLRFGAGEGPRERRPLRVGVVLSGGQAPGGHNVVVGLVDALDAYDSSSVVLGFLGGPKGILTSRYRELSASAVAPYRNTGGFDLIGSGRDKIETDEQIERCAKTCRELALDGLVIVGGDDSNTNAAVLAEEFLARDLRTAVVGVPKTIDGDMKGGGIEASFGFDTATKVYAELVGNIERDARSAAKYWHFVRLMGRSASHVTLECALRTRPNVALIAEEIEERGHTLAAVIDHVSDVVRRRAEAGRPYGVCLVPEGLIEFVPEMRTLIAELNRIVRDDAGSDPDRVTRVAAGLGPAARATFDTLPPRIKEQLLLDRDAHGNVQVSKIDTEALLIEGVREKLDGAFQAQGHFFGYEGRCAAPSNFDADYTYALGRTAAALAAFGRTGYIATIEGLARPVETRSAGAVPLTALLGMESRKGRTVPVIAKALVRTDGPVFRRFARDRERWALEDAYLYPGAIQYFGPAAVADEGPISLAIEGSSP